MLKKRVSMHRSRNSVAVSVMIVCLFSGGSLAGDGPPTASSDIHARRKQKEPTNARRGREKSAQGERPCPRAQWKNDPVCFDAPDEHTLPTPSSTGPTAARKYSNHAAPVAEDVEVGVKWGASNNPSQHGYDSIPMINSARRGVYGNEDNWGGGGPDKHVGAGVNLKF
ncbi:hypothetical protein [Methylosinus sp. LW4]|uniref:hypothetical protein n=1 Tax=Methylosinus sp. LW4 TaxID=136993 RepID=UPI0012FC7492|nr:hypothetical protein [Methylosinus sp. LW4]